MSLNQMRRGRAAALDDWEAGEEDGLFELAEYDSSDDESVDDSEISSD